MIKIDEPKSITYHDVEILTVPKYISKIEENPKVLEILALKKELERLNQKFEVMDIKIQGIYNESLQRAVNISHNVCTEFFNEQVKEINEKILERIIFKIKIFKLNIAIIKPVKLREIKNE